jgi:hypothetical protein
MVSNGKVTLHNYNGRVGKILSGVWALNKINSLAMPQRQESSNSRMGMVFSPPDLINNDT